MVQDAECSKYNDATTNNKSAIFEEPQRQPILLSCTVMGAVGSQGQEVAVIFFLVVLKGNPWNAIISGCYGTGRHR